MEHMKWCLCSKFLLVTVHFNSMNQEHFVVSKTYQLTVAYENLLQPVKNWPNPIAKLILDSQNIPKHFWAEFSLKFKNGSWRP